MSVTEKSQFSNIIKPYCYLKAVRSRYPSIHLKNGQTTRISKEGKILSPTEDHALTHLRIKPNIKTCTILVIYTGEFPGCFVNKCTAMCWYEYTLTHGHFIQLQPHKYEYMVCFHPPPEKEAELLRVKYQVLLEQLPKISIDKAMNESSDEYYAAITKANDKVLSQIKKEIQRKLMKMKTIVPKVKQIQNKPIKLKKADTKKVVKLKLTEKKGTKVKQIQKKTTESTTKTHKTPMQYKHTPQPKPRHVHFETRPIISEAPIEDTISTSIQTASEDRSLKVPFRHVAFKSPPYAEECKCLKKRESWKHVKFVNEADVKNVTFIEGDGSSEEEISEEEIIENVVEFYDVILKEEREHEAHENYAEYLTDRLLRRVEKVDKTKTRDLVTCLLKEIVEDASESKVTDEGFIEGLLESILDHTFTDKRKQIEEGFFEELLEEFLARVEKEEEANIAAENRPSSKSFLFESSSSTTETPPMKPCR